MAGWSRGLKAYFGIGDFSDLAITEGAAQPELRKFMDIVAEGFRKLSTAEKALLRNYCRHERLRPGFRVTLQAGD